MMANVIDPTQRAKDLHSTVSDLVRKNKFREKRLETIFHDINGAGCQGPVVQ